VAGDLIRVLDKILVTGYTGKSAAGWSHPVATSGNIASYKNASPANSGNGFGLVINENGPNATSTYKEAWATGWETVTGVDSPCGTGTGQFPTPAQLLTSGHVVIRKSTTASSVQRTWICFADSLTFYLFINTGDSWSSGNFVFLFGDLFSFKGSADQYRCMIHGSLTENMTQSTNSFTVDYMFTLSSSSSATGRYMPRAYGGSGSSAAGITTGDIGKTNLTSGSGKLGGIVQTPNGPDNAYYVSPLIMAETASNALRGRYRGLYHPCHPPASFSDGQAISGAGDYGGKAFQVAVGFSGGVFLVETSDTVETN